MLTDGVCFLIPDFLSAVAIALAGDIKILFRHYQKSVTDCSTGWYSNKPEHIQTRIAEIAQPYLQDTMLLVATSHFLDISGAVAFQMAEKETISAINQTMKERISLYRGVAGCLIDNMDYKIEGYAVLDQNKILQRQAELKNFWHEAKYSFDPALVLPEKTIVPRSAKATPKLSAPQSCGL